MGPDAVAAQHRGPLRLNVPMQHILATRVMLSLMIIRRMRMFQVYVAQYGDEWTITTEKRAVGRYSDRERAIAAAIDLANTAAKTGRSAEVIETDGPLLKAIWTAGKDVFPSSKGKPRNSRARGTYRLP